MNTEWSELTLQEGSATKRGRWRLVGENLEWDIDGHQLVIASNGDLAAQIPAVLRTLGKGRGISLRGCLTCRNFSMSSMAREMGRGQRGTCALHHMRVEICYLCPDYNPRAEEPTT